MDKSNHPHTQLDDFLPELPNYDPDPVDGVRVGESPVPGLTLRRILRGHTRPISRIAWSPNGRLLASPSDDKTIRIWDVSHGECIAVLQGHKGKVLSTTWSPDGRKLASGSEDQTIRIWDVETSRIVHALERHREKVLSVAWSPDGRRLASGSNDTSICLWDIETYQELFTLKGHKDRVHCVAWSPDGQRLASSSGAAENSVNIWNFAAETPELVFKGHSAARSFYTSGVLSVVWLPGKPQVVSCGVDKTIRVWDILSGQAVHILEGHSDAIYCLSVSADGTLLASTAHDGTRIWNTRTWETELVLENSAIGLVSSAFHPFLSRLTTPGQNNSVICIWDIDPNILLSQATPNSARYTTAKLVLVGDPGVGKTGLGWRLAHGQYEIHDSTHGQQFWVVGDLSMTRTDGTECEAVLWDLAGQHVYRPIHAIFLNDVDASLILFDPTNRQEPLKGVEFWLEQLAHKKTLPPSVLVGARLDRGTSVLSQEELAQFCRKHGISGGYIGTSAKEGLGLDDLLQTLKNQISWDQMTTTVTTRTFKRVKEYVLGLKEEPERKGILVNPADLRRQLEASDPEWAFSDAEMMTAVGHLANHGYVAILHSSSGREHILLTPELLVGLASSIILQADKHPRELGALNETDLLHGRYPLPELDNLDAEEEQILLDAAVVRFLEHNICFRETLGSDTLLIFPGLIKQKRPLQDEVESVDDMSYIVRGRVENIYPALVVLLGFTRTFTRVNQWQRQAQYEMGDGNICGFRLIEDVEGEIELVLYYSLVMPEYGRHKFQGLFEEFLYQRDVDVTRFPPVRCRNNHLQQRSTVISRLREGKTFLFCAECGQRVGLPDIEKQQPADDRDFNWIRHEEALARLRSAYETHLTRVKGYRRDRAAPRCYISHLPAQAEWVAQLAGDLRDAGVHVLNEKDNLAEDDLILIASTPAYQQSFKDKTGPIAADAALVQTRWGQGKKSTTIQLVVESKEKPLVPPDIRPRDFRCHSHYAVSLFDLVLTLYAIPHNHPAFSPLREALRRQWEKALSKSAQEEKPTMKPLKIFISYAHKDEPFKDELVLMLASMQRRGIINAWQDRRIEAGDEWYQAIQVAMNECDLALLLVSKNFLASRFIQDEEIPRLLQRRRNEGMRVIPIVIRPCMWSSEPVLQNLQALPKDGKAVITFPEETGERDQVWTDIAKVIESNAKALQANA